ncbi:MAG: PTS sorbitol transporter subunit IIB [Lachnospiraceae bacterium]|nr:PTS sorbitol transporter subunit IIB [Lachnospiraceae bacterium]
MAQAAEAASESSSVPDKSADSVDSRTGYHTITITRGDGGYGGPLTITPTEESHIVLYMTGGGLEPEPLAKIVALSGMEPVNGNQETCPDEEVALAIIDCGGTLRCGIYPGKGIPTVNILATGKSGPLAKYMTEDMYVSAVTSECVSAVVENVANAVEEDVTDEVQEEEAAGAAQEAEEPVVVAETIRTKRSPESEESSQTPLNKLLEPVLTISKVISLFQQSAREAVKTCLEMILPFMGFAALFIGICKGSGLTQFLAGLIQPMGGSLPGLLGLGIICSIPGLSAILGAGAVAAQMFSTVIGELIAAGSIPPAMALPALFAINCQCACDFIPVGLGMTEAKPETTQVGIVSITISRFVTGWIRILIAVVFSIGLYR